LFPRIFFLIFCIPLYYFCNWQTDGFRFYEILSDRPSAPQWELSSSLEIRPLLQQEFSYLGKGATSYAFLGQDKKTVLKFFRHPTPWRSLNLNETLQCCKIAYQELREETGIIYPHLTKTINQLGTVTIRDKIGVAYYVDLDQTEFVLQEYAVPIMDRLKFQLHDPELLKKSVTSILKCIDNCLKKGYRIPHPALRRNFGFIEYHAISLDIGSFLKDTSLQDPTVRQETLLKTTHLLARFLKRHQPALYSFYEEEVQRLVSY
jgi:hypothetical protein